MSRKKHKQPVQQPAPQKAPEKKPDSKLIHYVSAGDNGWKTVGFYKPVGNTGATWLVATASIDRNRKAVYHFVDEDVEDDVLNEMIEIVKGIK